MRRSNANLDLPSSTSFGPYQFRSNAMSQTPNFNQRPSEQRSNAIPEPPRPILTRGQSRYAAMPRSDRLLKEGSVNKHRNVRRSTPFPTSYRGSVLDRRNAKDDSPPPVLGHLNHAAMLISKRPINFNQRPIYLRRNAMYLTPRNQGDPIWTQDMKTRL